MKRIPRQLLLACRVHAPHPHPRAHQRVLSSDFTAPRHVRLANEQKKLGIMCFATVQQNRKNCEHDKITILCHTGLFQKN